MTRSGLNGATLRIGDWSVSPASGEMSRGGEVVRVETRSMRLLVYLAEHAGEVVSIDDLLKQVWPDVVVTPDSVYQAVASLRRVLGDDPKQPAYIATVPRLGYRMVATVSAEADSPAADPQAPVKRRRAGVYAATGVALLLTFVVVYLLYGRVVNDSGSQAEKSIAVLPFLDLTEGMSQEYFADGMTEELIAKLSKTPGVRVRPPTTADYMNKDQAMIADLAKQLRVGSVLDGSVRKSGDRIRVAARLVRADDGFVIWSETYDRPFDDILMIQDDIAERVTNALQDIP